MKYIKTPVSVAGYDIGSVYEANGSELCCCYGMVEDQRNKSAEIAMALNEYDRLVAERDAMAEALEAHAEWKDHTDKCVRCGLGLSCLDYPGLQRKADELTRAALALMRREGEK